MAQDVTIDLHGTPVGEAAARVREELRRAFRARAHAVTFVHGVGNHSEGGVSPLAREVREWLKALEATPHGAIRRLEFGEESGALARNPGCVRAHLALALAFAEVAFDPAAAAKTPPRSQDRKRAARRAPLPDAPGAEEALRKAEEELRKRFGEKDLGKPYRPPSPNRGEWPGR